MDENKIIEEANVYLSNDKTIKETAKDLNISKRTLQLHLKKLEIIDENLYKLVLNKKASNQKDGRIKGGKVGKRGATYTEKEAINIAKTMVEKQLTYQEASLMFDIPTSTIYDIVHSDYIDLDTKLKLDLVSSANRVSQSLEEYVERKKF